MDDGTTTAPGRRIRLGMVGGGGDPSVADGVAFIEAAVRSAAEGSAWTRL
ncbi:hypothetical protein [Lichenibacterium ramalinae]|nr:hypothetical protein [Lichenibacterium ramalinae]